MSDEHSRALSANSGTERMRPVLVRMPADLWAEVQERAKTDERSASGVIRIALRYWLLHDPETAVAHGD